MSTDKKAIILYPREYNRRGDESLHSVEGVTQDGQPLNIKLRVSGEVRNQDAIPSISKFAKTDIRESRFSCLSSSDNSPENPAGILLFTDCEIDTNNRKSVVSYVARWAHILRSGQNVENRNSDLPFIGIGRLQINKETKPIRDAKVSIEFLKKNKPSGWEDAVSRHQCTIENFRSYDYYMHGYLFSEEKTFGAGEEDVLVEFMDYKLNTCESKSEYGFMIRIQLENGSIIPEIHMEIFPHYNSVMASFQSAREMISYFKRINPDINGLADFSFRVMPIIRVAGKKVFKDSIKSQADFKRLEESYYINGSPQVFPIAVKISQMDNKERLISKIHLLGPSVGSPLRLDSSGLASIKLMGDIEAPEPSEKIIISSGLSPYAKPGLAEWYNPAILSLFEVDIEPYLMIVRSHQSQDDDLDNEYPNKINQHDDPVSCVDDDFDLIIRESIYKTYSHADPMSGQGHGEHVIALSSIDHDGDSSATLEAHGLEPLAHGIEAADGDIANVAEITTSSQAMHCAEMVSVAIQGEPEESARTDSSQAESAVEPCFDVSQVPEEEDDVLVTNLGPDDNQEDSLFGMSRDAIDTSTVKVSPLWNIADTKCAVSSDPAHGLIEYSLDMPKEDTAHQPEQTCGEDAAPTIGISDKESSGAEVTNNTGIKAEDFDDNDLLAWMDDDELKINLSEAPDAYSEETESDSPTSLSKAEPINPLHQVIAEPEMRATVSTAGTLIDKPKEKRGGLAGYIKKKGLL